MWGDPRGTISHAIIKSPVEEPFPKPNGSTHPCPLEGTGSGCSPFVLSKITLFPAGALYSHQGFQTLQHSVYAELGSDATILRSRMKPNAAAAGRGGGYSGQDWVAAPARTSI